ncbi:MAG: penicillin-binding protein 2 [Puniceicoccales bacterium]|jgi:cell division protein FtsI/penicillin-binding protein 2|nr:penicillin-binding protein 2 [Puniceicoccales bacterium]
MRTLFATGFRFWVFVLAVIACFSAVFAKLWWLHVHESPRLRDEAIQARKYFRELPAPRGVILDSRGTALATTHEVWDIYVDPHALTDDDFKRAGEIARILGTTQHAVEGAFAKEYYKAADESGPSKPKRWAKLAEDRDADTERKIEGLNIKAVYASRKFVRDYPNKQLAAHIIGYVKKDGQPVMGVEREMNSYLTGKRGWYESMWDGRRNELAHLRIRQEEPSDGPKVQLTIDSVLQEICEQELEKVAGEFTPKSAVVIVSEPSTGEIRALANWPTFDLNRFGDMSVSPLESQKNRAATDVYEPGSVFKIVAISMGLNEGLVTPNTTFDCGQSSAPYRGKMLPLPSDTHWMGVSDIRRIVWESSNRGTVQVALRVAEARGEQTLYDYARNFGFGQPTGIITGSESAGILHAPKDWDGLTITRFPMGHAVSVTALQIHFAMATIANKGVLLEPKLIDRILSPEGEIILKYPSKVKATPITPQTAKTMVDILQGVCKRGGSASAAEIPNFEVAGKTGTTQKIITLPNGKKGYSSHHHVASFSGFFPASNPRYVITVIIDEPNLAGVGYGGKVAAPVFKRIAEKIIDRMALRPPSTSNVATNASSLQ